MTLIHGDWRQEVAPVIGEIIKTKKGGKGLCHPGQTMQLISAVFCVTCRPSVSLIIFH